MADAFAELPGAVEVAEPGGLEDALLELRSVGYCVVCERLVERDAAGRCGEGHLPEAIHGQMLLASGEQVPELPTFNLGAFLLPILWGPAHGQWVGGLFLPIWLFADSAIVTSAQRGGLMWIAAAVVASGTLAFQYFFARHANGVAYRRLIGRVSVEEYLRRERIWAIASIPVAAALLGWAIYFDLVLRSALKG